MRKSLLRMHYHIIAKSILPPKHGHLLRTTKTADGHGEQRGLTDGSVARSFFGKDYRLLVCVSKMNATSEFLRWSIRDKKLSENTMALPHGMELEHAFVKTPYEAFAKFIYNGQKLVEKEALVAIEDVRKMNVKKITERDKQTAAALKLVSTLKEKCVTLKRKLEEGEKQVDKYVQRSRVRLQHMQQAASTLQSASFARTRLDRAVVEHLLRSEKYDAASALAGDADMKELCDVEVFLSAKNVIDSLRQRDCSKALAWCALNRAKLRKIDSQLEIHLRIQEAAELLRKQRYPEALAYARQHLASFATSHASQIQEFMGVFAFSASGPSRGWHKYETIMAETRWSFLVDEFRASQLRLNSLATVSTFALLLHSGLSSLKTSVCGSEAHLSAGCPLCSGDFLRLATDLPVAHRAHSSIVCRISGEVMNENNPPLALPNGNVYSRAALTAMAQLDSGYVTCPRTHDRFLLSECRNVFVL